MSRPFRLLALLLLMHSAASAQEADYSEERIAPSRVPVPFMNAAQKEAPGLRFSAVYKDNEKDYRFVAKGADGKTTAVKLDREGKLKWRRTYTDVAVSKLPKIVSAALQDEIKKNKDLEGFQMTRSSLVDRFDAIKNESATYYEFFGKTPIPRFPRVEIDAGGKVLAVNTGFLPNTGDYTKREPVALKAIPPEVQAAIIEAIPGIKVSSVLKATTKDNPVPVYEAFGRTARGRGAEVWVHGNGSLYQFAISVPLREVPKAMLDAITREAVSNKELEGFKPSEARTLRFHGIDFEDFYQFFGDDKEGRPLDVRVGADGKVMTQSDNHEVFREEAGISSSEPKAKDAVSARGFSVIAARYGLLDRWIDVTEEVRQAVSTGLKEFKTSKLPDPFFGSHKTTVMVYAMDGKVGLSEARDDEPLPLDIRQDAWTLAEVPANGFAVLAARYGAVDKWEDVTVAVRQRITDGRLSFKPLEAKFPDPAPGVPKMLAIVYASGGKVGLALNHEARALNLPPEGPPVNSDGLFVRSIEFPQNPTQAVFTADGRQVVVGVGDGSIRILDATSGREVHRFDGHGPGWVSVSLSASGTLIASGGADNVVRVWDVKTEREKATLRGHTDKIFRVAMMPNGRQVVSTAWDKTVRLWDVATGREVRKFEGHTDNVTSLKFTPDGRQLVTISRDKSVRVWDVASGREVHKFQDPKIETFDDVSLSKDGRQVFFGCKDGSFRVWEYSAKKDPIVLNTYAEADPAVTPMPDGHRFLIGDFHAASMWDYKTGRPVLRLEKHIARVTGIAVSPDGKKVVTCAEDRTLKIWRLPELGR